MSHADDNSVWVVVLTLNEERHIARCLEGLPRHWNVLIVDSGSTDATRQIVSTIRPTADFVVHEFAGYGAQRQFGLDWVRAHEQASPDAVWILFLDADEICPPRLQAEVTRVLSRSPEEDGFYLRAAVWFRGRYLTRGAYAHHRVLRLVRLSQATMDGAEVNERLVVSGATAELRVRFLHHDLLSLEEWLAKQNSYSTGEARRFYGAIDLTRPPIASLLGSRHARIQMRRFIYRRLPLGIRSFANFFRCYVLNLGFIEGRAGFEHALLWGFYQFFITDLKIADAKLSLRTSTAGRLEET